MLAIMYLLCRSVWGTFLTGLVIVMSVMSAVGMAGHWGLVLGGPNIFAPIIILTIAAASCVHLLKSFLDMRRSGSTTHNAVIESLRINLQPILLTGITTALGFLSIRLSNIPAFHVLALVAATGILVSILLVLCFLPAALSFMANYPEDKVRTHDSADLLGNRLMLGLGSWVVRRNRILLILMSIFILSAVSGTSMLRLNDTFVGFLKRACQSESRWIWQRSPSGVYVATI